MKLYQFSRLHPVAQDNALATIEVDFEKVGFNYEETELWKQKDSLNKTYNLCQDIYSTMIRGYVAAECSPLLLNQKESLERFAKRKYQHVFSRDGRMYMPVAGQ